MLLTLLQPAPLPFSTQKEQGETRGLQHFLTSIPVCSLHIHGRSVSSRKAQADLCTTMHGQAGTGRQVAVAAAADNEILSGPRSLPREQV